MKRMKDDERRFVVAVNKGFNGTHEHFSKELHISTSRARQLMRKHKVIPAVEAPAAKPKTVPSLVRTLKAEKKEEVVTDGELQRQQRQDVADKSRRADD